MVKLAENVGFGFDKMDYNWKKYNQTSPEYQIEFDSIVMSFTLEKTTEKIVKTSEKIIQLIQNNPMITTDEMAQEIEVSTRSIERNIDKLKKEGRLKRVGPDKGGHWEVVEK